MFLTDTTHTWHVAQSGNDANTGHATAYPVNLATDAKLTINAAIAAASPGDTIIIWPGTYIENVVIIKTLRLIGFGRNITRIQSATSHGIELSNSGAAAGSSFKNLGCVSTASGLFYGINLGVNNHDCLFEDCYGEGDYDGIHLRGAHRVQLLRCHGKGHYDGIQAGTGEGHRVIDCTAETDGANTVDAEVNAFVCGAGKALQIRNLYCKARRDLDGDTKYLTGCLIKGGALIDGLTLDVQHTGSGNHNTKGLSIDATGGMVLARHVQVVAETDEGDLYGVYVGDSPNTAQFTGLAVNLKNNGGGTTYGAYVDNHADSMGILSDGRLSLSIQTGTASSATNPVTGFEKNRFIDNGIVGIAPDDFWNGYLLLWTTGANAGESQFVDDFLTATNEFHFASDFSNPIQPGDSYKLYAGGIPTRYDLYNAGGRLQIAQLAHDPAQVSGTIEHLAPRGHENGSVDLGRIAGDDQAIDSLLRASAVRAHKATQDKLTGAITIRNADDTADQYLMTLDDNNNTITRTLQEI